MNQLKAFLFSRSESFPGKKSLPIECRMNCNIFMRLVFNNNCHDIGKTKRHWLCRMCSYEDCSKKDFFRPFYRTLTGTMQYHQKCKQTLFLLLRNYFLCKFAYIYIYIFYQISVQLNYCAQNSSTDFKKWLTEHLQN